MAIPDISNLSLAELRELIAAATLAFENSKADLETSTELRRIEVVEAISTLDSLLGVEGSAPNTDSIRGVLAFSNEEMVANAGIAFRLAFQGLEILTKTVRDIAYVVA